MPRGPAIAPKITALPPSTMRAVRPQPVVSQGLATNARIRGMLPVIQELGTSLPAQSRALASGLTYSPWSPVFNGVRYQ